MNKNIFRGFIFLLFFLFLYGCTPKTENAMSVLPDINQFSSFGIAPSKYEFPPIQSAFFVHDGVKDSLELNDPRLYRLLNALSYSYEQNYTAWRQGYVKEDEFLEYLNAEKPYLDIYFLPDENPQNKTEFSQTPRAIISANRYLLLVDTEKSSWMPESSIYANEHFPFAKLLCSYYEMYYEEVRREVYGDIEWGNSKWLDLLAYAGFEG